MFRLFMEEDDKMQFVQSVYENLNTIQTMIFCNKKDTASKLQAFLRLKGIAAEKLIGDIEQKERDKIIDDFRLTNITCLISTNVLARGIDVPEVDLVINYDVPFISDFGYKLADFPNFLHRVGRTGRFGTEGVALSLYSDETYEDLLDQIEKYYGLKI